MKIDIEDMKQKAEAATPGPWVPGLLSLSKNWIKGRFSEGVLTESEYPIAACSESRNDAAYIAAANPAAVLELIRQRDELLAELKNARELVEDWGAYASNYMQEKHDLAGDIDRLDAAIAKAEG
jgi:hypothetical protein